MSLPMPEVTTIHPVTADCNFCETPTPATADAPTVFRSWAYMCDRHYQQYAQPGSAPVTGFRLRKEATANG